MSWVRIDDNAIDHPKFVAISSNAFRLWCEGMTYCQKHLTDGFIPAAVVRGMRYYSAGSLKQLVVVQVPSKGPLWHEADGGYRVHDYHDWNESRDRVLEDRRKAKERMDRFRGRSPEQKGEQKTEPPPNERCTTPRHATCSNEHIKRARGHESHVYCGGNFCVSKAQEDKLLEGTGNKRGEWTRVVADDYYRRWDAENAFIPNLLPWLRTRIRKQLGIHDPAPPGQQQDKATGSAYKPYVPLRDRSVPS